MAKKRRHAPDVIGPWLVKKAILNRMDVEPRAIVVFDVGASVGEITAIYQRMWPDATYHCFEPVPTMHACLKKRFAGQDQVLVQPFAIAEKTGKRTLHMGGRNKEMSSLLPRTEGRRYFRDTLDEKVLVDTIDLDTYCRRQPVSHIHVLKVDIQGGEMLLLEGARRLLKERAIDLLYMEIFFVDMYEGAPLFWELCQFLDAYGYTVFDIYAMGRSFVSRQLKYGDALWISRTVRTAVVDALPDEWLGISRGALEQGATWQK